MPFIPTAKVILNMIARAAQLKTTEDIMTQINPKERKRLHNEMDLHEPVYEAYCKVRVLPKTIKYPELTDATFFEQTGLVHLATKYEVND